MNPTTQRAFDRFDKAARNWGYQDSEGTGLQANAASAEYDSSKSALRFAIEHDIKPRQDDLEFVQKVERDHFRTDEDTGSNACAMMIWNIVRRHFGLPPLQRADLPAYCATHDTYHIIRSEYGCERKPRAST